MQRENQRDNAVSGRALKIYTACYDGKLDEVKRIVEEPVADPLDVNAEIHGGTAFAAAVQNGYLNIVKYLVECGADINRPIHDGATPVFIAAYRGYIDIVAFLIAKKANLETPNSKGRKSEDHDVHFSQQGTPHFLSVANIAGSILLRCWLTKA